MDKRTYPLRMIAWELTRNCNLDCIHCRARASSRRYENELSLEEIKIIVDDIAAFSTPTIILTGGEPLLREDIFDIAKYISSKGLRAVIAVNGTLVDRDVAIKLKESGILRVSMSIDGKDQASHDSFRKVSGSFDAVMRAGRIFNEIGLPFQINTTVTRLNFEDLGVIYDLVRGMGAVAWHVFLLVPVGRGEGLKGEELNAALYEEVLNWLYVQEEKNEIEMKVTCAPHYYRIVKEKGGTPKSAGCLAGKSFLFISHTGIAQPCGYLELPCGDIRKEGVRKVWEGSQEFGLIRDLRQYKGKCGSCKHLAICGGCRARAQELKGDLLEAEPYCSYGAE
jgi:radical SAM protein with 4Fe4S-binding SPASM domain